MLQPHTLWTKSERFIFIKAARRPGSSSGANNCRQQTSEHTRVVAAIERPRDRLARFHSKSLNQLIGIPLAAM